MVLSFFFSFFNLYYVCIYISLALREGSKYYILQTHSVFLSGYVHKNEITPKEKREKKKGCCAVVVFGSSHILRPPY